MWLAAVKAPSVLGQSVIAVGLWTCTLAAFGWAYWFARKWFDRNNDDIKSNKNNINTLETKLSDVNQRLRDVEKAASLEADIAYLRGRQDVLEGVISGLGSDYLQSVKDHAEEHCQAAIRRMDRTLAEMAKGSGAEE